MRFSKVSKNFQVTIPIEIRSALCIKPGDELAFFRKENGEVVVVNKYLVKNKMAETKTTGRFYSDEELTADTIAVNSILSQIYEASDAEKTAKNRY